MDFVKIKTKEVKKGVREVYPEFSVERCTDLMIKGKDFYAVWDEEAGLWSTNEYDVARLVDNAIREVFNEERESYNGAITAKYMKDYSSGSWSAYQKYKNSLPDNFKQLDTKVCFASTEVRKKD